MIRSWRDIFFHCDHPSVTSSRRHFVKSYDWPYLYNGKIFLNHIWYTLTSGQGPTFQRTCVRARLITDAYARVKIKKCSKLLHFKFIIRFRSFWAFQNFPSVRVRARVVRARSVRKWSKFKNCYVIWIPLTIIDNFHLFHSLLTFHKAVSARQSSKSARAAMGNIMQIWSKTCHFWNRNSSSECPMTPNFYIMVGKSMSWRYDSIPPWSLESEIKSSYLHLNSKNVIFIDDVIISFVQLRLSRLPVIDFLPHFDML